MDTLTAPDGGTPEVIVDRKSLQEAITKLSGGQGPIAIDAERASGYRYSSRAYLIQLFRRNGGLHLIDPIPLAGAPEVAELSDLLEGEESVIHASSQDLACLREFGIRPKRLFDTELGARLAGFERVGLGSLCESLLGISLAKEHSAVDWSIRPLRQEWLDYAALDVALLVDLRDEVAASLIEQEKMAWAQAEFQASLDAPPNPPRRDPWRRTSGMHKIKSRYELAIIRELWTARDLIAAELDIAPGRLLSDLLIIEFATSKPKSESEMRKIPLIKERIRSEIQRSHLPRWWQVLESAYLLDERNWPEMRMRSDSLPPPKIWKSRYPLAYAHLKHARANLLPISVEQNIPIENLIAPDLVKRICFDSGSERRFNSGRELFEQVRESLEKLGARKWQIELTATAIASALLETEPPVAPSPPSGE